jgi:ankyrin repeat protein
MGVMGGMGNMGNALSANGVGAFRVSVGNTVPFTSSFTSTDGGGLFGAPQSRGSFGSPGMGNMGGTGTMIGGIGIDNASGILTGANVARLHIETGWISETDASGRKVVELIPLVAPLRYKSVYFEGSRIRSGLELSSPILREIPQGGVIDVIEKCWSEGPPDCCVPRARLLDNSGWTSFLALTGLRLSDTLLEYVGVTPGVSNLQERKMESAIVETDSAARLFLNEIPLQVYQLDPLTGSSVASGGGLGSASSSAIKNAAVVPSSLRNLMKTLILAEPRLASFISPKSSRGLLHAAIEYRDKEFIPFLLHHSASICSNVIVEYVKAFAVTNGKSSSVQEHAGIIKAFCERGAELDETTICQSLSTALVSKDIPLVKALLDCGASLAKVDAGGIISHGIIDKCLNCGSVDIAERLVRSISNIKAAIQQSNIDIVVSKNFDGLLKFIIESGMNPQSASLFSACSNGSVETLSVLLDIGMDIGTVWLSPTSVSYVTPLIVAALFEKIDACEFLIKRGARLLHQSDIPSSQIESMNSMSISVADTWTKRLSFLNISEFSQPKSNIMLNRAGIEMKLGTGSGSSVYYCGRALGYDAIPGSDGRCGPNNGPQCDDCRNPLGNASPAIGSTVKITDLTTRVVNDAHHICVRAEYNKLCQEELCIQNRRDASIKNGDTEAVKAANISNCIKVDKLNHFIFSVLNFAKGNTALLKCILDAEPDILRLKSDNGESLLMMILKEGRAVVHQSRQTAMYSMHHMQNTSIQSLSSDKIEKMYQTLELVLSYPTCEGYASSIQEFCQWNVMNGGATKKCDATINNIYRRLVETGGDVQIRIGTSTPIFLATSNFNVALVDLLLRDNASVTADVLFAPFDQLSNVVVTSQQFTDIFTIIKRFVEKDSEIATLKNSRGDSIVKVCCSLIYNSQLNSIVDLSVIIIDFIRFLFTKVSGSAFNSDIFSLVDLKDEGLISTIISRGANLNDVSPSSGSTVLIDFVLKTHNGINEASSEKFLKFLIDNGLDVNFYPLGPSHNGHQHRSALYLAVNRSLDNFIRILEQAGARLLPDRK